jgi:hypothetical protein
MPKDKPKDRLEKNPLDPDALVDEAIEESFPASDPISPGVGPGEPVPNPGDGKKKPRKEK